MNLRNNHIDYWIDNEKFAFEESSKNKYFIGKNEILSNEYSDITYYQDWYQEGFSSQPIFSKIEYKGLREKLTECIANIIFDQTQISLPSNFILEDYHKYITNDENHFRVVKKTRDLYGNDFNFPILKYISVFEDILKLKLTDFSEVFKLKMHIIIRINRPNSNDFNPPHKDMYEGIDALGIIPKFINIWIPIAGVNNNSVLPLVPGSHIINENKILRTKQGGFIANNTYRVRMIKSWEDKNKLTRPKIDYNNALIFSSHLIHGLALNLNQDSTRVALEFRLFKK